MQFSHRSYPKSRLRRLRMKPFLRTLAKESQLMASDLVYPLFVMDGYQQKVTVDTFPQLARLSIDYLVEEVKACYSLGIRAVVLFPSIDPSLKDGQGSYACDPDGLIPDAIQAIKAACPEMGVVVDIALDPYTDHGQDGVLNTAGEIDNDLTVKQLIQQALCYAAAGADVLAPSDMMDGRIAAIRQALERGGFPNVVLLSYAAKYASAFYGPFRDLVGSKTQLGSADKRSYQMDPANTNEALHEVALDLQEGADIVMVKPGLPYLDVLHRVKATFAVPTWAYQVSGEYSMLRLAIAQGVIDEHQAILESLLAFKRAGADVIVTYFAKTVAGWLASHDS